MTKQIAQREQAVDDEDVDDPADPWRHSAASEQRSATITIQMDSEDDEQRDAAAVAIRAQARSAFSTP